MDTHPTLHGHCPTQQTDYTGWEGQKTEQHNEAEWQRPVPYIPNGCFPSPCSVCCNLWVFVTPAHSYRRLAGLLLENLEFTFTSDRPKTWRYFSSHRLHGTPSSGRLKFSCVLQISKKYFCDRWHKARAGDGGARKAGACGSRAVNFAPANEGKEKILSSTKKSWQSPSPFQQHGWDINPTFSSWLGLSAAQTPARVIVLGFREKPLHKSTGRIPHSSFDTTSQSWKKPDCSISNPLSSHIMAGNCSQC